MITVDDVGQSLDELVRDLTATGEPPFQICPGPATQAALDAAAAELPATARILRFAGHTPPALSGPAILVLAPGDFRGPDRDALLALARAALPGRPVLLGGTRSRDVLLEAINVWRVFRVLPEGAGSAIVADALGKAYQAIRLETGLEVAAAGLWQETKQYERTLASLEATLARQRHAERLASLGRVTSSLIPALQTHFAALEAVSVTQIPDDPELAELLACASAGVKSLHAMLDEIREYSQSRCEAYRMEPQDLDKLVKFVVTFSRFDPLAIERDFRADLDARARIKADGHRLQQVVVNLVRNALQATPPGGTILVRTRSEDAEAIIDVENTGPEIPASVLAQVFEPFFSTKGEGGLGLGLALSRTTVERHGGSITCSRTAEDRTQFRIRLPRQ